MSKSKIIQYKRKQDSDWQDLPTNQYQFTAEFLKGYHGREDVDTSYELACVLSGEYKHKTLDWFYEGFPQYNGFSIEQLKKEMEILDTKLYNEARKTYRDLIKSGLIERRCLVAIQTYK